MSRPTHGHWLDRLALRQTRRGFLRSAVAATAALALPLGRPPVGGATNPNGKTPDACRRGCNYDAHKRYAAQINSCNLGAVLNAGSSAVLITPINIFLATGSVWASWMKQVSCQDKALIMQKARMYECLQPDCGDFDPGAPDGPCAGCVGQAGKACCPYQAADTGYVCCAQCCHPSGDGCGSGSACGG